MRRFAFYILIAVLAFGISSTIVFKFFGEVKNISLDNRSTENFIQNYSVPKLQKILAEAPIESIQKEESSTQPLCHDEKILPVWRELVKDKGFRDWSKGFHESINCADMLEIREIDLNQDGRNEIILRGKNFNLCSAVGNCAFWIYEKKGKKYKRLLYSTDYFDATELPDQARKTKTNKYFDIELAGHMSGYETLYARYKFDGKHYREGRCMIEIYHMNDERKVLSCRKWNLQQKENSNNKIK